MDAHGLTGGPGESSDGAHLDDLLAALLTATRCWARKFDHDSETERIRHEALALAHARYLKTIPIYRQLAEEQGIGVDVDLNVIVNEMMFGDDAFKSYDLRWLQARDFSRMTDWLARRFAGSLSIDVSSASTIGEWRALLKREQVYVMCSTGTSGKPSFVPRDSRTLRSMRSNGEAYLHSIWTSTPGGGFPEFDCLVLGPRGTELGLLAAGSGLADAARRAHFLIDSELTTEGALELAAGARTARPRSTFSAAEHGRSLEFLSRCTRESRRVIAFGPPFLARAFCERTTSTGASLRLHPGSLFVSGGGWKSFDGERIPRPELQECIEAALGIPASHVIDTYSAVELNSVSMTCSEGRYHLPPLVEPVVLAEDGTGGIGKEGTGTLGFLDPFAFSYPGFVVSGDRGTLARDRCACGMSGWSIVGEIERSLGHDVRGCAGSVSLIGS